MSEVMAVVKALEVLAPLIRDVVSWIRGGSSQPTWLTQLPTELRTTIVRKGIEARRGLP